MESSAAIHQESGAIYAEAPKPEAQITEGRSDILSVLRQEAYVDRLIEDLEQGSLEKQVHAAHMLVNHPNPTGTQALLKALKSNEHVQVREAAAESLVEHTAVNVAGPLIRALLNPDEAPAVKAAAAYALSAHESPETDTALKVAASNDNEYVQRAVSRTLKKRGPFNV